MTTFRRAFVWASVGQYLTIGVNFAVTLVLARLLAPAEFGVAAVGGAILGLAEAVRDLAGGTFLIGERDLSHGKIRSTATVNFLVTLVIAAALLAFRSPLVHYFEMPALGPYLSIVVVGYMFGPLLYPQQALMSREMAFDRLAFISFAQAVATGVVAVTLALAGFRANSFAWAGVAATVLGTLMCLAIRKDISIFRPSLSEWRRVVGFGVYSSTTAVLGRLAEAVPLLIFGRLLGAAELAIGHRSVLLCLFPERLILAAVGMVALPELSRQSREGGDLKRAYLLGLSSITAVHWPAMVMLALLADPIVRLMLGHQWLAAIPLVRIISPALMFAVPLMLQFAILVAANSVQVLPRLLTLQTLVMAGTLFATAPYGLHAAALGMLVAMPINGAMSLLAVGSRIGLSLKDIIAALQRSAVVTAAAAVPPLAISLAFPAEMPLGFAVAAGAIGGVTWLIAMFATGHPLWPEIVKAGSAILRLPIFRRQDSSR